jgi:hypothetical protein
MCNLTWIFKQTSTVALANVRAYYLKSFNYFYVAICFSCYLLYFKLGYLRVSKFGIFYISPCQELIISKSWKLVAMWGNHLTGSETIAMFHRYSTNILEIILSILHDNLFWNLLIFYKTIINVLSMCQFVSHV